MQIHRQVHRRILIQLAILLIVAVGLFVTVVHDALVGEIGLVSVIVAAAIGIGVGYLAGRMFLLSWHEDTQKVIMRMDRTGFVLIALYVVFRMFSAQILGSYFSGVALSAISFAVLDGILVGRFLSIWRNILRILTEQSKRGA
jgi:hypothetical protein